MNMEMNEQKKMLSGKIYDPSDKELEKKRMKAHRLSKDYNNTYEDEWEKRKEIIEQLIPNMGENTYLLGPIQFDYGVFTTL